ncbi:putative 1-acyl-sn-glycerol-3-phosphate acyltransferase 5 [Bienertia sinuspersici]
MVGFKQVTARIVIVPATLRKQICWSSPGTWQLFLGVAVGLWGGLIIGFLTEYYIYDVTIGYKPCCPFMENVLGVNPFKVHIHIRHVSVGNIPDYEEVGAWLIDRFCLKDKLLYKFYSTGHFPNEGTENNPCMKNSLQFHALSDQMFKLPDYHKFVRKEVVKQVNTGCSLIKISYKKKKGVKSGIENSWGYAIEKKEHII